MCLEAMDGADRCRRGAPGCPGVSALGDALTAHQGATELHLKSCFYYKDISNVGSRDVERKQQFSFLATRALLQSIINRNAWNWNER